MWAIVLAQAVGSKDLMASLLHKTNLALRLDPRFKMFRNMVSPGQNFTFSSHLWKRKYNRKLVEKCYSPPTPPLPPCPITFTFTIISYVLIAFICFIIAFIWHQKSKKSNHSHVDAKQMYIIAFKSFLVKPKFEVFRDFIPSWVWSIFCTSMLPRKWVWSLFSTSMLHRKRVPLGSVGFLMSSRFGLAIQGDELNKDELLK